MLKKATTLKPGRKKSRDGGARGSGEEPVGPQDAGTSPREDVKLQNKMEQLDPAKAQLDWFSFETRIRKIVYELLSQPMETVQKMTARQLDIDNSIGVNKRRTDEHEFILYKFQKRADIEAEYEARISKMELEVKTQLAKSQASMADLTVKMQLTAGRSQALQDQTNQIQGRLDQYLDKLKDDIDKIAGKNNRLFGDFMEQMQKVDKKYEDCGKRMQQQEEFFQENKERYQDCLAKSEQLVVQLSTQEAVTEGKLSQVRAEIDRLDTRINAKDKQNTDMLMQVIDVDLRSQTMQRDKDALQRKLEGQLGDQAEHLSGISKHLQVIRPIQAANLVFESLQAVCRGSQFNRVLDQQERVMENLERALGTFDPEGHYDLDKYEIPPVPERQAEDVKPTFSQGGQHKEFDVGSLRSGASKLGASRKAPLRKRDPRDKTKNSGEAGRNAAIQEQTESGALERDGTGSIVVSQQDSSAQSNASLGQKRARGAHASVGVHSKQPSSLLEPIQQARQEQDGPEHQRHASGKTAVAVGNLGEETQMISSQAEKVDVPANKRGAEKRHEQVHLDSAKMVAVKGGDKARAGRDRGATGAGRGEKETDNGVAVNKNERQTKPSHHKSNTQDPLSQGSKRSNPAVGGHQKAAAQSSNESPRVQEDREVGHTEAKPMQKQHKELEDNEGHDQAGHAPAISKAHANYHKQVRDKNVQKSDSMQVPAQPSQASKGGKSRQEAETPNSSGVVNQKQTKKAQNQQHREVAQADPGQQDVEGSYRADNQELNTNTVDTNTVEEDDEAYTPNKEALLEAEESEGESEDDGSYAGRAPEQVVTQVPVFDEEKTRDLITEMLEESRGQWLEEDEARQQELVLELAHEVCAEMVTENINYVNERAAEQGVLVETLRERLEALTKEQHTLRLDSAKKSEALESMIQSESKKVAARFKHQNDTVTRTFADADAANALAQNRFRILMKDAFDNFKVSIELEQTKRMRQIGDLLANQSRIMGQYSFNEKNYKIFQMTSAQICDSMNNIIELFRVQNSLNFQEEKDKQEISLVVGSEGEKFGAEGGTAQERQAKHFMRDDTALAYRSSPSPDRGPDRGAEKRAHVEIETRCSICQSNPTQSHQIARAMKLACLKYSAGSVNHLGTWHERMKLIKIQEDLVEHHSIRIQEIVQAKHRMEASREVADGLLATRMIGLQDLGVDVPGYKSGPLDYTSEHGTQQLQMHRMYSSSEFAAAFNETQLRGRPLMEADLASQSAESQSHLQAKPIQTTDNSYSKPKAGRGYGPAAGVRTFTHESTSKQQPLDRVKELAVITHKKGTESPMPESKNDYIQTNSGHHQYEHQGDLKVERSTGQDAFHNLDLNLAGIDSKLRTPNPAGAPGDIGSAQRELIQMQSQAEATVEETLNSLTADRVDKKDMDRMDIQVTVENQQSREYQRGAPEDKADFMRLKNEMLTNQAQDANIRQVNISVLAGKQATYELRKQSAGQFRPSNQSEFRFPNIERLLPKDFDATQEAPLNSRYDSRALERTATLEMQGGQPVTRGQQKGNGDRSYGQPEGMNMRLESSGTSPAGPGKAVTQALGNRKITMDEPQIQIKSTKQLLNAQAAKPKHERTDQILNRSSNQFTVAAHQSLNTRTGQTPTEKPYNKPAAPLVRVNMDSGHLLRGSGLHSTQSKNGSAYEEYMHPEATRSQSRGISDRRASAQRGMTTKTPAVGHHKDSMHSYQSSVYDFSKRQAVTQGQKRPSSSLSAAERAGNQNNKYTSATCVELRTNSVSSGLHTGMPRHPAQSQAHFAGTNPASRLSTYGAVHDGR